MLLLDDILLDEHATIKEAIQKLEKVRCKVVYIVHNKKLIASVSDGDVRRWALEKEDINNSVCRIANMFPRFFYESQKEELRQFFASCEAYSAPILNLNGEVIEVAFRNGTFAKHRNLTACPVVIMAGGKGTRLYPYTKILPKALIPVGEIPIAEMIINSFQDCGCSEFFMILNHKKKMIKAYFDGCDREYNIYFLEEEKSLGTGGGLYLMKDLVKEDFFFTNCDILIDADYESMYWAHKKYNNAITIIAAHYRNSIPYGVIDMDDRNQYKKMLEKPNMDYLINTGLYIVNPNVLNLLPDDEELSFPDIIEQVKRTDGMKVGVYTVAESAYMDMGQLEELDKMQRKLNL